MAIAMTMELGLASSPYFRMLLAFASGSRAQREFGVPYG